MSVKFSNIGGNLYLTASDSVLDKLPPNNYALKKDEKGNYFLSVIDKFSLPSKIYGNNSKYAERIFNTFKQREGISTAAILSGLRGSGKSITAKEISIAGLKEEISTIVINEPFCGTSFNEFVQKLPPVIILFDEFEKTYENRSRLQSLLTLLDGTFESQKLFLMTMNSSLSRSEFEYFNNRPGRIYFNIEYGSVTLDVIKEYCADRLNDQTKLESIIDFIQGFTDFTLDLLSVLVTEMNNTGETPQDLSVILNIKPNKTLNDMEWDYEYLSPKDNLKLTNDDLEIAVPRINKFISGQSSELLFSYFNENKTNPEESWVEAIFLQDSSNIVIDKKLRT